MNVMQDLRLNLAILQSVIEAIRSSLLRQQGVVGQDAIEAR